MAEDFTEDIKKTVADTMKNEYKAKFLSYLIPKAIVEEWKKLNEETPTYSITYCWVICPPNQQIRRYK